MPMKKEKRLMLMNVRLNLSIMKPEEPLLNLFLLEITMKKLELKMTLK
jgi:hypothetical protein